MFSLGLHVFTSTISDLSGGVRVWELTDALDGTVLVRLTSQAPETMRPWFAVPGKESEALMRVIWKQLDREAELNQMVDIPCKDDKLLQVRIKEWSLLIDGKQIKMSTRLLGAFCHRCPATHLEMKNPVFILYGFPILHDINKLNELALKLMNEDGVIISMEGDYKIRFGLKYKPMTTFLDPTDVDTPLHDWIRDLSNLEKIAYNLNSREDFPKGIPVMERGKRKGKKAALRVQRERLEFIEKAKNGPLQLTLDSPDPSGYGGSTDNANTARKCLGYENREHFLDLFKVRDPKHFPINFNLYLIIPGFVLDFLIPAD